MYYEDYDDYDLRNRGLSDHRRGGDRDQRSQTAVVPYGYPPPVRRPPRAYPPPPPAPYGYPPPAYGYGYPPPAPPAPPAPPESKSKNQELAEWVPDILRGLAAIMPMPNPPAAEPDVGVNVANLITYFGALAQTGQRKEQLHTLAAIAARHL